MLYRRNYKPYDEYLKSTGLGTESDPYVIATSLANTNGEAIGIDASTATHEWVLKRNTKYVLVVTNEATGATNECNIRNTWYEHTRKDT